MSILTEADIDAILHEHQASKITSDMLDAEEGIKRMLEFVQPVGEALPWPALFGNFELRPGELTLLAGTNGSGKSMLAGQIVAWAMTAGMTSVIASMEMRPQETLRRMVTQCSGGPYSREFAHWWGQTYRSQLWLWDVLDRIPAQKVLARVQAVSQHLGARLVVIDSLMKCGLPADGDGYLTKQADFVDSLQHAAKHLGTHIILVVHLKKPERGQKANKYDIRGASQISDIADNVLLCHPNMEKRMALKKSDQGLTLTSAEEEHLERADFALEVDKQRHAAWEGIVSMDLHRASLQFRQRGYHGLYQWPHRQHGPQ